MAPPFASRAARSFAHVVTFALIGAVGLSSAALLAALALNVADALGAPLAEAPAAWTRLLALLGEQPMYERLVLELGAAVEGARDFLLGRGLGEPAATVLGNALALGLPAAVILAQGYHLARNVYSLEALEYRIADLIVYPVKGCAGHRVLEATVSATGLEHDRSWMIVQLAAPGGPGGPDAYFMTQRQLSHMATITPSLPADGASGLVLAASGRTERPPRRLAAPLAVPLVSEGPVLVAKVWGDLVACVDQGDEAASWLQDYLNAENLRLVRKAPSSHRPLDPRYAGPRCRVGASLSDGFPLLAANAASLRDLNSRVTRKLCDPKIQTDDGTVKVVAPPETTDAELPPAELVGDALSAFGRVERVHQSQQHPHVYGARFADAEGRPDARAARRALKERAIAVGGGGRTFAVLEAKQKRARAEGESGGDMAMARFRPNVVVEGAEAWDEDRWASLGGMDCAKPCSRCSVPTIQQISGLTTVRGEPTDTLRTFRTGRHLNYRPKWAKDVFFGVNLVHGPGHVGTTLRVGDAVAVRRRRPFQAPPAAWLHD